MYVSQSPAADCFHCNIVIGASATPFSPAKLIMLNLLHWELNLTEAIPQKVMLSISSTTCSTLTWFLSPISFDFCNHFPFHKLFDLLFYHLFIPPTLEFLSPKQIHTYGQKRVTHLCTELPLLCWIATVLEGLFGEYHSSSAALGQQHPEVTRQPLLRDWLATLKRWWCETVIVRNTEGGSCRDK